MHRGCEPDQTSQTPSIRGRLVSGVVLAALLVVGCTGDEGEARFEVDGIQKFDECLGGAFPLEPTFMATQERIDSVGIFLQTKARIGPAGDLVYLEVFDKREVAGDGGRTVSFEYPSSSSPPARVKVATWDTCPNTNLSLAVEGTVRFDSFGVDSDDRMVGELTEGTIVDARTGEVVAESFTGFWDFAVQVAAPYRTYPNERDDYRYDP